MFARSWTSDWNHGNAHFLRGLAQELMNLGHEVRCYEEEDSWSRANLRQEGSDTEARAFRQFRGAFPNLAVRTYRAGSGFADFAEEELRGTDIVLVHEWNRPEVVNTLLELKGKLEFKALFHDTHHRAYTSPKEILRFNLDQFDGVLAFGEAIRKLYIDGLGIKRAWTFHEAAATGHFRSFPGEKNADVVWVGNWGDEERTRELEEFLTRKGTELVRGIVGIIVRQPDAAALR